MELENRRCPSWRVVAGLAGMALAAGLLVGCGPRSAGDGGTLQVVASFEPIAEVAAAVGGNLVRVRNLTPTGAEPHDLELTTDDVDQLEDADLVLYLGEGFQPALEKVASHLAHAVDLLRGLPLDTGGEGGANAIDPHVWLDPTLLERIVEQVTGSLVDASPSDEATLRANAAAYRAGLTTLDADYRRALDDCARRTIVTSHAAFHYLARRYQLEQEPISGLSPDAEPDPRRIAELADMIRREGVTTVFFEALVSPSVAQTLAREAGVQAQVLDPIEGISSADRKAGLGYVQVMRRNLTVLVEALGCRTG
jgi:zinc transport system substrate-binding protein